MNGNWLDNFTTFGELLRHLRRQAQLTQQQLGIAIGYSPTMITRLENGERLPDLTAVKTVFVEALSLQPDSQAAKRLIALAGKARSSANAAVLPDSSPQAALNTNLPTPLTPTIGREWEIGEIERLVKASRLVTLTGAGGVGKTRLAVEAGRRLLDEFPAGAWLVELAPVTDATLVPQVVAAVFGIRGRSGQSAVQALTALLADKSLLIVLDNCEHIITACAGFAEQLLGPCPHLRIMATSREALRVPGEVAWRVPSLVTPEPAARLTAEQLMDCASAQLFVQQAAAAQPGFTLADEDVSAVAQICRRLDGIPLAIEMAAARLPVMTVDEIAARLDQRFQLLTSGRRMALPRQQTLHATLEWSYHLLSEPECLMLERLSVFADGCLADAAVAVYSDSSIRVEDVLSLLLGLVDKSLLVAEQHASGTRYRMLETVRAFAAERLGERDSAEGERLYKRHLTFMIELADRWWRERLTGAEKTNYILRLETELSSVRALLGWARGWPDGGALSLELAGALYTLWVSGGFLSEGQAWLEEALARGRAAPAYARARALASLAQILSVRGEYTRLDGVSRECLELAERIEAADLIVSALRYLGTAAEWRLDFEQAIAHLTRGLGLAREAGLLNVIPPLLITLGRVYLQCGERSKAADCLQEGVTCAMQLDILPPGAEGRRYLSLVDLQQTLRESAQDVDYYRAKNHSRGLAMSLLTLGHLLVADGQYEQANCVLAESHDLWRQIGLLRPGSNGGAPLALFELARLAWLQGQPALSLRQFNEYLELVTLAGDNDGLAHAHLWMGYVTMSEQDLATAESHFRQSLTLWQEVWHKAVVLAALARLAELKGDPMCAARLYGTASAHEKLVRTSLTATDRLVFDRNMETVHSHHDHAAWTDAWAEGEIMKLERAVAYALGESSAGSGA